MNWYFFGGVAVAAFVFGVGALLWHFDKIVADVQSWGHIVLAMICAFITISLGLQLWTDGGFLDWCWKLPVIVVAGMAAIVATDIGLHGDHPR